MCEGEEGIGIVQGDSLLNLVTNAVYKHLLSLTNIVMVNIYGVLDNEPGNVINIFVYMISFKTQAEL